LTWGYFGGPIQVDGVLTAIADSTVALTLSATNYVEATRAGVVSANTTGFTAGRCPLYTLVCSASAVTSETDHRPWVDLPGVFGRLSKSVAGGSNVTLTAAEARCDVLNFTGLLTGSINVVVPDGPQGWTVTNNTTGAFSLTVKTSAGTGIAVTQGKAADLLADGTNVILGNNDAAAIGGALLAANNLSDVASAATARTNLGLGTAATLASDTDTALGANSDTRFATQKAVKAYIDSLGLAGFRYLLDLSSTAASDPGAGLVKLNHATLASVTEFYVDDSTNDSVDLSTLLASLGSSGLVKLTSMRDVGEWVVYKWTASPTDNTGWWTFTVVHQAGLGSFEDDDEVQVLFLQLGASGGGITDGDKGDITISSSGTVFTIDNDVVTNAKAADVATATIKGRTTAGTGDPEDLTAAQAAAIVQGDGLTVDLAGFRGVPGNSQSTAYTAVAADAGKSIDHPATDANARTFTIPANASVAYPIGTCITFTNMTSQVVTIAITTDTMYLAGAGTTGSRSLAQYGVATARKQTSTTWLISGTGLT
jgi:hypothetical protein